MIPKEFPISVVVAAARAVGTIYHIIEVLANKACTAFTLINIYNKVTKSKKIPSGVLEFDKVELGIEKEMRIALTSNDPK